MTRIEHVLECDGPDVGAALGSEFQSDFGRLGTDVEDPDVGSPGRSRRSGDVSRRREEEGRVGGEGGHRCDEDRIIGSRGDDRRVWDDRPVGPDLGPTVVDRRDTERGEQFDLVLPQAERPGKCALGQQFAL